MTDELQRKVDRAVKLIQQAGRDGQTVEVAYSGGKDSDVILELTRMAGIKYRAIYKNTTIDPPGTIAHAKENGAEVLQPKERFFELVAKNGAPNRFNRHCCRYLKEYKVLDRSIMGVRKAESTKRAARYSEPTECRFYGSKKAHVEAFYPILDWSDQDVVDFIVERGIKIHPLYFREDGTIDPKRRLGCMCCPLASVKNRVAQFKEHPGMVKAYIRAVQKFRDSHPDSKIVRRYDNVYEWFVRDVFYDRQWQWEQSRDGMFGNPDYKQFLEQYFNITL
jgi:phosphoadenosine phosphosulfate reductase